MKAVTKKKKSKTKAAEKKAKDVMAAGMLEGKEAVVGFKDGKKTKMSKKQKEKELQLQLQQVNGAARKEVQFQTPVVKEDIALMEAQELQDVEISVKVEVSESDSKSVGCRFVNQTVSLLVSTCRSVSRTVSQLSVCQLDSQSVSCRSVYQSARLSVSDKFNESYKKASSVSKMLSIPCFAVCQ